jgi:hypothetical protein
MINKRVSTSPVSYVSQKMVNLGGRMGRMDQGVWQARQPSRQAA